MGIIKDTNPLLRQGFRNLISKGWMGVNKYLDKLDSKSIVDIDSSLADLPAGRRIEVSHCVAAPWLVLQHCSA